MDLFFVVLIAASMALAALVGAMSVKLNILPIPDETRRMGCLDGLRGYLALIVMVHHYIIWQNTSKGINWSAPPENFYNNLGSTGVALFFMASGALFYKKILQENIRVNWRNLYISRVVRIVPLMWFAVAVILCVLFYRGGRFSFEDVPELLKWLFFVDSGDMMDYERTGQIVAYVTWSLRFEWVFYFLLPVLALSLCLFGRYFPAIPNIVLLVVCTLLVMLLLPMGIGKVGLFSYFGLGMIALEISGNPRFDILLKSLWASVVGAGFLFTQMVLFHDAYGLLQGWMLLVFFTPVLAGNSYFSLLSFRGSVALGEVSYGVYLLHGIVLSIFFVDFQVMSYIPEYIGWMVLPLALVFVVMVSISTFLLIERPMIRFGKSICRSSMVKQNIIRDTSIS